MKFIPDALINFVMKHVSIRFLKKIVNIFEEVNNSEHNQWKNRIKANPEFYEWLRRKLEVYHKYN
jgi:hypothetical protein